MLPHVSVISLHQSLTPSHQTLIHLMNWRHSLESLASPRALPTLISQSYCSNLQVRHPMIATRREDCRGQPDGRSIHKEVNTVV